MPRSWVSGPSLTPAAMCGGSWCSAKGVCPFLAHLAILAHRTFLRCFQLVFSSPAGQLPKGGSGFGVEINGLPSLC